MTGLFAGTWESFRKGPLRKDTANNPLDQIVNQVVRGDFNMSPPYQRGLVWTLTQKRRLINSIVVGLSLPAIYLREMPDEASAQWVEVVDGKQRLATLAEYLSNRFSYDGKMFSELNPITQRFFRNTSIPVVRVSGLTDAETVELYERLNFGGVPHIRETA